MILNKPTEMLILAGGFGTRLQSLVRDVPKPMAPVAGRPFLEYLIDYWIGEGIERFILSTGYLADVIQSHFGKSYKSAAIDYLQEKSPLGTGGALRSALNGVVWRNEIALMVNGDTWFPVALQQLCKDALQQDCPITIALKRIDENDRYSGVEIGLDGRIKAFGVKCTTNMLINAGCYIFVVDSLKHALVGMPEKFSLEADFLAPYAITDSVGASIQNQPFLDIGIPDDYKKAIDFLT